MAKTKVQIDMLNEFRKDRGEEPLPYETEDNAIVISDEEKAEKEKELADAKIESLRIEAEEKAKLEGENKGAKIEDKNITPAKVELTKEEKEAIARELFGVADLADLIKKSEIKKEPTPEEIDAAKEKREGDKIAYALSKGKFTKKQYENFIADAKDPISLVLNQYGKEQKELDPNLTNEEIENEFNSKFGLDGKEDSRQYKRGLKEINLLAENILKQNYSTIYDLDSEFSNFENQQLTQKQLSDKLISEAPNYKKTVEDIYAGLNKITIPLGKEEKYEVEIPAEIINALKNRELGTEYAATQIKNGYTKEEKAKAAETTLIFENLPMIIKSIADKIVHKKQAGSKGIPDLDGQGQRNENKKLTEAQEKVLKEFKETYGLPVAN